MKVGRDNLGRFEKGVPRLFNTRGMLGKKRTDFWKKMMSERMTGVKRNDEFKLKCKERMLGIKGVKAIRYIDGRRTYRKFLGSKCFDCGSTKSLIVHHKDENRKNNHRSNLRTICPSCHFTIYHPRVFYGNQHTKV